MPDRSPHPRKRRTREHVIADLSVNHVERQALACGFAVERVRNDYGIGLEVYFFDEAGYLKNGRAMVQVKATDRPAVRRNGTAVAVRVDARDLAFWRWVTDPVIPVLYDASRDRAHWLHVQPLLWRSPVADPAGLRTSTLYVPGADVIDASAVRQFERLSDERVTLWRDIMDDHG